MDSQTIVDILLRNNGNLSSRLWQGACQGCTGESTIILRWFDSLGITKIDCRRNRVLCVPLLVAVEKILAGGYVGRTKQKPGRKPSTTTRCTDYLTVLDDPTYLFNPGSQIPASQVFGTGGAAMPEPDEFPEGIRLAYKGVIMVNDSRRGLCVVGKL